MNFVVAVDFTASNGDPSQQNSLHFVSNQYPNQYVQAIRAVGDIVEDYDTDKVRSLLQSRVRKIEFRNSKKSDFEMGKNQISKFEKIGF